MPWPLGSCLVCALSQLAPQVSGNLLQLAVQIALLVLLWSCLKGLRVWCSEHEPQQVGISTGLPDITHMWLLSWLALRVWAHISGGCSNISLEDSAVCLLCLAGSGCTGVGCVGN